MPQKLLRLFATPVIVDEVEGAGELNAALETASRQKSRGCGRAPVQPWWLAIAPRLSALGRRACPPRRRSRAGAGQCQHRSALGLGAGRWTVDAWANVNEAGSFNLPHVHGGSFWSAVYYVNAGDGEGGELVLHDPRMPGLRMHAPNLRFKQPGPELKALVRPKSGMMVMFPAWLSHSVEPWDGNGTRISVAMNIRAAMAGQN